MHIFHPHSLPPSLSSFFSASLFNSATPPLFTFTLTLSLPLSFSLPFSSHHALSCPLPQPIPLPFLPLSVARSLASCQGALLLVDSTQSVQAQTLANHAKAKTLGTSCGRLCGRLCSHLCGQLCG